MTMNTASDMDGDFCLPGSGIWRDAHRRRWSVFRVSFFRNTFARGDRRRPGRIAARIACFEGAMTTNVVGKIDAAAAASGGILSRERIVAKGGFNRWLVPPAALAIHLCIGMAYGFSVFWLPLSRSVGTAIGAKVPACAGAATTFWDKTLGTLTALTAPH